MIHSERHSLCSGLTDILVSSIHTAVGAYLHAWPGEHATGGYRPYSHYCPRKWILFSPSKAKCVVA